MTRHSPVDGTPEDATEVAAARLVAATRDLMLAVGLTDLPGDDLDAAREQVEAVTRMLGKQARERVRRMPFDLPAECRATGRQLSTYRHNPFSLPMRLRFDDPDAVVGTFDANALAEGPPDCVHGGVSAWLMDNVLGVLVQSLGIRSVTGTLELRYLHRTPLDQVLDVGARVVERSGRRLVAEGWVEYGDQRTVQARGIFVQVG